MGHQLCVGTSHGSAPGDLIERLAPREVSIPTAARPVKIQSLAVVQRFEQEITPDSKEVTAGIEKRIEGVSSSRPSVKPISE
jgi:hypothetical protein